MPHGHGRHAGTNVPILIRNFLELFPPELGLSFPERLYLAEFRAHSDPVLPQVQAAEFLALVLRLVDHGSSFDHFAKNRSMAQRFLEYAERTIATPDPTETAPDHRRRFQ